MVTAKRTFTIGARPGLLRRSAGPLLVVPDPARAGTPVTRAVVTTLGADVVHVERPGVSERWPARARWLAACAGRDVAALSSHLLDRFPVRVDGVAAARALDLDRVAVTELLGQAGIPQRRRPQLPPELLDVVLRLDTGRPSIRRSPALARVARAVAERRGAEAVRHVDVRRAAALIGVTPANEPAPAPVAPPILTPPVDPPTVGDLAALEPTGLAVDESAPDHRPR
jgi:magnesium chelatase subunit D